VKFLEIRVHIQNVISAWNLRIYKFDGFGIRQVRNNVGILGIVNNGSNQETAVTGRTCYLQKIKATVISQDFNIAHFIFFAATGAFDGGHQFFYDAFFHNLGITAIIQNYL
jgi:hypothetical protein